ncbi:MAG: helix-turn-helix transcriptional regulator [Ilumatobacteraceae bacterium]
MGSAAAPGELLARAVALRHGGFVRDAVEVVERTLSTLPSHDHQLGRQWALLAADLSVLTGRTGPEIADGDGSAPWRAVRARAAAAADPTGELDPALVSVPTGNPLGEVRALLLRGLTTHDVGLLMDAAASADAANLPVEAGEAWLFAAETAARHGGEPAQRDVAQFTRQATERLHRCAVRGWDARLQRLSERHVAAAAAAAPASAAATPDPALEALSAAEWRVAAAVAGGLTNREVASTLFLSVKTVDFHLQQIYRKLALRSRTELAVRVAGHAQHSVGRRAPGTQGAVR